LSATASDGAKDSSGGVRRRLERRRSESVGVTRNRHILK
jgi:hypothetical protein